MQLAIQVTEPLIFGCYLQANSQAGGAKKPLAGSKPPIRSANALPFGDR
ncbi:MAG: hypothetical protein ACOC26_02105 [Halochromatium sp.]